MPPHTMCKTVEGVSWDHFGGGREAFLSPDHKPGGMWLISKQQLSSQAWSQ